MRPAAQWLNLLRHFVARDLKQRYLGSLSGGLWALLQPLLMFAIYAVVFVQVLKVRLPEAVGSDFVPFLVTGLWPWTAFAEGLSRGTTAIPEHAGLLAKVALPREVLVLAPVTSSFLLHLVGFTAVLIAISLLGRPVVWSGALAALGLFLLLYMVTVGLALAFAAIQVFVRDLAQVLGQVLTLWFFLTPVFYTQAMVPAQFARVLDLNPMSIYISGIRAALSPGDGVGGMQLLAAAGVAAVALLLGTFVFRRLSRHFEDFL